MSEVVETIKAVGSVITPIALAWIALQQFKIRKEMNGMKDQLITSEKSASKAEGNLEGRAELKGEQNDKRKGLEH